MKNLSKNPQCNNLINIEIWIMLQKISKNGKEMSTEGSGLPEIS